MTTHERIHIEVREHYAAAARAAGVGKACFGPEESTCVGAANYGDLGELPDAAALASLGCGNPTAVAELREGDVVLDLGSGSGLCERVAAKAIIVVAAARMTSATSTSSIEKPLSGRAALNRHLPARARRQVLRRRACGRRPAR